MNELIKMLQSKSGELDLNKVSLFMTILTGISLTSYAVITNASFAEVFFGILMATGAGTTVTKGVVDTMQKRKDHE